MNNTIKMNRDMIYAQSSRADVRATRSETLLMTAMVCFAPFTLCAMMLLSSAI